MNKVKTHTVVKNGIGTWNWNVLDFEEWFKHYKFQDGYSKGGAKEAWSYQEFKLMKKDNEIKELKEELTELKAKLEKRGIFFGEDRIY